MVAVPILAPVTCGWMIGVVCPAGMVTVGAERLTLAGSLLTSAMVTDEEGADDKLTFRATAWPSVRLKLAGTLTLPAGSTVTLNVVSAMFAPLAWITAVPATPLVTATFALVAPAAKITAGGTVATFVLLEVKLMVRPPEGAAADRFSTAFTVAAPVMVRVGGTKVMVAVTCTAWDAAV
jgi:hypothetical protein